MSYLFSILLGVVEGVTEFLPISSTAHLILASELFRLPQDGFQKSFEIIIQLGAILAVVWFYGKTLIEWGVVKRLAVAFLPTGIIGFVLYSVVKHDFLGNMALMIGAMLIGGIAILFCEKFVRIPLSTREVSSLSYRECVIVGFFQSLSMIPGVSRAAATIIGGLLIKIPRQTIVEFSFLLAVPTMLAATIVDFLKSYQDIFDSGKAGFLLVGFIAAFVTALFVIRFLQAFIKKHSFAVFGWYRIALALVALIGLRGFS